MARAMVVTVGTGPEVERGIAFSIQQAHPDTCIFLVSRESRAKLQGIESCIGELSAQRQVVEIAQPDDLESCYRCAQQAIQSLFGAGVSPGDITVDITSGTKPMSAGLALAAADAAVYQVSYVTGERGPNGRVLSGAEELRIVQPAQARFTRLMRQAKELFNRHQFGAVGRLLSDAGHWLFGEMKDESRVLLLLAGAYARWDAFLHRDCRQLLLQHGIPRAAEQLFGLDISDNLAFLAQFYRDGPRSSEGGDELCRKYREEYLVDLLENAHRRAEAGKYDDAVARLYRSLEYTVQLMLARVGIDSAAVKLSQVPKCLQSKFAQSVTKGKSLQIGLKQGLELLQHLGEPWATAALEDNALWDALRKRNSSILAHGMEPVGEKDYQSLRNSVEHLATQSYPEVLQKWSAKAKFPRLA